MTLSTTNSPSSNWNLGPVDFAVAIAPLVITDMLCSDLLRGGLFLDQDKIYAHNESELQILCLSQLQR